MWTWRLLSVKFNLISFHGFRRNVAKRKPNDHISPATNTNVVLGVIFTNSSHWLPYKSDFNKFKMTKLVCLSALKTNQERRTCSKQTRSLAVLLCSSHLTPTEQKQKVPKVTAKQQQEETSNIHLREHIPRRAHEANTVSTAFFTSAGCDYLNFRSS